jgi:MFS family permease
MAGSIAGPLIGGLLPSLIGIRQIFFVTGAMIFCAFVATAATLSNDRPTQQAPAGEAAASAADVKTHRSSVVLLLVTGSLIMFATMSVEPIVTVFVESLDGGVAHAPAWAGASLSLTAVGAIVAAPRVGRLADNIGRPAVITGCLAASGTCLLVQAAVTEVWQFAAARLLMGLSLGGLMPCVTASLRQLAPVGRAGRLLGLSVSAQYAGQVLGPLSGALAASLLGLRPVFVATACVLLAVAGMHMKRSQPGA